MDAKKRTSFIFLVSLWILFCMFPAANMAAVAVQSEIASGHVVKVSQDYSIEIDNGKVYHPSREELKINVAVGDPVSLKYVVQDADKNVYFEYAPGLNTLKNSPEPAPLKNNSGNL